MSSIEKIDGAIEELIKNLAEEHGRNEIFARTSAERKSQIINEIATLRASMNPQFDHKK